ncbi:SH3 domain-binding glutamic acid-rich-like protein 3 [Sceloporus undulatus]|uniref:SH3 domain-binding glutamic acid-rich-like protein 3 n=1 Tax=Sceloporus undulatus TaxID=8520 RepID=UPI001C4D5402|nr:SH3 domain-binding glutamic acid-rich-like protein 3 [Sceloporus undulatus]
MATAKRVARAGGFSGKREMVGGPGRDNRGMEAIRVYYTSVTGSREVKQQQSEVFRILDGKRMKYQLVDVSLSESLLQEMRSKAGKPGAIPPQIFNGEEYCGDFEMLHEATENEEVPKFLKIGSGDHMARGENMI